MKRPDPAGGELETALGYQFRDRELLRRALTHRSFVHERDDERSASYERLEFLGDALLGFVVADRLYRADSEAEEGTLSDRRQRVVRTSTLARVSRRIGLNDAIRLGRGESRTGGREKASLLADLFEAVLAAIYLDGGIRAARSFVRRHLDGEIRAIPRADAGLRDPKTRLQERTQARLQQTPRYRIVSRSGPDHSLQFVAEVVVGAAVLGRGTGSTRKQAEQRAARQALGEAHEDAS